MCNAFSSEFVGELAKGFYANKERELLANISTDLKGDRGGKISFRLLVHLKNPRGSGESTEISRLSLEIFDTGRKLTTKSWNIEKMEKEEGITLYEKKSPFSSTMLPVIKVVNPNFSAKLGGRITIHYDENVMSSYPELRRRVSFYIKELRGDRWILMDSARNRIVKRIHCKAAYYWGSPTGIESIKAR